MSVLKTIAKTAADFVTDPKRTQYPGIYEPPEEIARKAAERAAPESDSLRELFGVTRDDLYNMMLDRDMGGPSVVPEGGARGSAAIKDLMTDANRERLVDTLRAAGEYPEIYRGMDSWYVMDPAYQRTLELTDDPDVANELFSDLMNYTGMASPGSDVNTELTRGSAANWLAAQGRFDDFEKYGGRNNAPGAPEDMRGIPGHPYHSTSQSKPMRAYLETGDAGMKSPKVPAYIQSSLPDELGRSWRAMVPDAHFTRAVGASDTRKGGDLGASMKLPEAQTIRPWWESLSADAGLLPVPAQARAWGTFGHATGVDTAIGAPKLELLADNITRRARERGIEPSVMRDLVLLGGRVGKAAAPSAALLGASSIPAFADDVEELERYLNETEEQ